MLKTRARSRGSAYLRQFVPDVLAAVQFDGGPGMDELLRAVRILAGLYATKARKVPEGAPDGFVPARWAGYLEKAAEVGDVTAYRHYWELCVLMALRDGLRSGDVYVPGARRYADPASFLLTPQQWEPQRLEFCRLAGKPASAADALALAGDELHAARADLETQLAGGGGPGEVRLGADGELIIPQLTAEDVPAEAEALRAELGALLPRVPIASVLVEIDARTGFTGHLVHAGGKAVRPAELQRNLLYVIIAEATNMGLGAMAESCGVPYDVLAWTAEWYFSAETLEAANAASSCPPASATWARSPSTGPGRGPISCPATRPPGSCSPAGSTRTWSPACGDDLLRIAASVKGGHATAALVVGKLCSSRRQQNALASAIKEYGALRRTVYAARYLADETYRRRIGRQLNKGENLHALQRSLAYAGEGALRRRHHEEQTEQMWCLTLATNAVVTWTTEYYGLAVTALRRAGRDVDDAVLAHIWPTHHENVHFYGTHSVDVDGELAKLDSDGYRPLRILAGWQMRHGSDGA